MKVFTTFKWRCSTFFSWDFWPCLEFFSNKQRKDVKMHDHRKSVKELHVEIISENVATARETRRESAKLIGTETVASFSSLSPSSSSNSSPSSSVRPRSCPLCSAPYCWIHQPWLHQTQQPGVHPAQPQQKSVFIFRKLCCSVLLKKKVKTFLDTSIYLENIWIWSSKLFIQSFYFTLTTLHTLYNFLKYF